MNEEPVMIYLNYDGIPGDVTTTGHEKWIEVHSFQWGVGRGITSPVGGAADREGSTPSVSEVVITKDTDQSSPNFLRASLGIGPGAEGKTILIDFCKTDAAQPEPYLQFELDNTLVSGFSMSSGGDRPSESVSLNFTKVTMNNIGMGAANETGTPDRAVWDLSLQTGS
jgi:type VI secretion system secreted protein Hcp